MLRQQLWSFIVAFISGIAAGIIFDIYRVIRRIMGLRKIGTAIGDVFVWMLISITTFCLLVLGNWAEIRAYVLLAIISGLAIYLRIASRTIQGGVYYVFKKTVWAIRLFIKSLTIPCQIGVKIALFPLAWLRWLSLLVARVMEYLLTFPYIAIYQCYKHISKKIDQPPQA